MRWYGCRPKNSHHPRSSLRWRKRFFHSIPDLIEGFSIRLPLYHHQRRFRVIVVSPEVENLETSGEFKYGRVEGRNPTLEQFNHLVKATVGSKMFAEVTDPSWLTYFVVQERMV